MPTTQQLGQLGRLEQQERAEQHRRETLDALIAEQVLHALGKPGDLLKVQVRPLWEDYCRVNVWVGVDAVSARVAHSYFLVADGDGGVRASTPGITRQY
jgi:hypothetical protein